MKILFDHQIYEMQQVGGISRYFHELKKGLSTLGVGYELPIVYSENQYLLTSDNISPAPFPKGLDGFMPKRRFKGKKHLFRIRERLAPEPDFRAVNKASTIAALRRGDFDIFHPTYYDDYFLPYLNGKPFVLTVHDFTHEIYPEYFFKDPYPPMKCRLIKEAAHIVAVSENTKNDAIRLFQVNPSRITVAAHGPSLNDIDPKQLRVPGRYFLFVGGRDLYKNFYFFLRAVRPLFVGDSNLHVVCTGKALSFRELEYIANLGLAGRVVQISADDAEIAYLYKHAIAFVFPSLHEGFGIPVLEAFSCGCPVLASDIGALVEVAGDAALYFSPKNYEAIYQCMRRVLSDSSLRTQLIELGYERVKLFSWQQMVKVTTGIYRAIAASEKK